MYLKFIIQQEKKCCCITNQLYGKVIGFKKVIFGLTSLCPSNGECSRPSSSSFQVYLSRPCRTDESWSVIFPFVLLPSSPSIFQSWLPFCWYFSPLVVIFMSHMSSLSPLWLIYPDKDICHAVRFWSLDLFMSHEESFNICRSSTVRVEIEGWQFTWAYCWSICQSC